MSFSGVGSQITDLERDLNHTTGHTAVLSFPKLCSGSVVLDDQR